MSPASDQSTLSSYESVNVNRTHIAAKIDWAQQKFAGTVTYTLSTALATIRLDTSYLDIEAVKWCGENLSFHLDARESFRGQALVVNNVPTNSEGQLSITFSTTRECTGLQFLSPEQTIGKKAPFLFSQCEPIHARSIFPCFDTPAIKSSYRFEIESAHRVLVSGTPAGNSTGPVWVFEQKVPIPSYLFAIASGNLEGLPIGKRSTVWAEPEFVKACQWEFEADTEKQLAAAEKLVFPYEWGTYDVLILPPSFPFGGMENPNMTFATPTLIAGDRTLVNVIAHELAHSWSGNLVSNASWSHFWLNEGWTVYIERRILGALHGEAYRHFAAIEGWSDLVSTVNQMPAEYTKLRLNVTADVDPDDTFSTIPYEKGSTFLWYLEELVGRDAWDKFIPQYFTKFKYKSLTTDDFKNTLYEYLDNAKLDTVDWNLWLDTPGLPPKPEFNDEQAVPCKDLAERWLSTRTWREWASPDDIKGWNTLQLVVFLNILLDAPPLSSDAAAGLGSIYGLGKSNNCEIKFRWLQLAVGAGVTSQNQVLADWLGTVGRMKYVRPGYQLLKSVDRDLAMATFEEHKSFYHAICRGMVEKDLQK